MRILLYISFIGLFAYSCSDKSTVLNDVKAGVPLSLAEHRRNQVSDVVYTLNFKIPKEKEEPIISRLVLDFTLKSLEAPIYIDFKEELNHLKHISCNGKKIAIIHENEHIAISQNHLAKGPNAIEIDFWAGELSLNRNEEFLYTLLVPDRARTLFPCFDQPNIKATYILEVTAPKDWEVLCGAPETQKEEKGGFTLHQFAPSDKMSTYLFSFVAGKFKSTTQSIDNFNMKMLYRETDEEKVAFSTDAIFELHQQSISFLETYTDYPFPFQKLDFATIPGFQYGGMEHVGAIQYREGALFLDESATENQKLRRAKLIAHETAHMWFGDLVTMDWFNDVWMKEVFANFMADKIVNPAFPQINHELAFMVTHYPRAYSEDRTKGTNPIRQNLANLNNAGSLYGSIIYNKAPIMMRQLENTMGKEAFRKGIQEYIKTFENGNAVWNDLIEILDKNTEIDLKSWSKVWVNSSGRPIFNGVLSYTKDGKISSFEIKQEAEDGSEHIWPQTFEVAFVYEDSIQNFNINIDGESLLVPKAEGLPKPNAIIYNSNCMGYGIFPLTSQTLTAVGKIENETTRGYNYINAYENTLNGTIEPLAIFKYYEKELHIEKNELLSNLISGYLINIFWKYLSDEERLAHQQSIADQLWATLQTELPSNIKKTIFTTFKSIAFSEKSRSQLYEVWSKQIQIPNLKLNKDDYTAMAMELALFRHEKQKEILSVAESAISNPDKLERFKFILPSVSEDEQVKNHFFESLKEEKKRAKEAWVASAMSNLNHPLHQQGAIQYLRTSLDLLEEIQKTGDIFFPKRWLSSTIGNHTSPEAYRILEGFLSENPDLNPSLIQKIKQASDNLRRVQLMNKQIDKSVN